METSQYQRLKERVEESAYKGDIEWAEQLDGRDVTLLQFVEEYTFVVVNSGMKAQIAREIYRKVMDAFFSGKSATTAFGHYAKACAIDAVWEDRWNLFDAYNKAPDKVAFCQTLPWIGPITKFHLAKNLGVECVKPDRHLVRIAALTGETPEQMCRRLAEASGDRLVVVDTVIWRAANQGWI